MEGAVSEKKNGGKGVGCLLRRAQKNIRNDENYASGGVLSREVLARQGTGEKGKKGPKLAFPANDAWSNKEKTRRENFVVT